MNGFTAWMDRPIVEQIGWALLHSLWQGGVAAVLYAIVQRTLHRRSAELRYWLGCGLLLVMLAGPVFTAFIFSPAWLTPRVPVKTPSLVVGPGSNPALLSSVPFPGPETGWLSQAGQNVRSILPWLVCVWLLGVVVCTGRWVHGYRWVKRVRSATTESLDPAWVEKLAQIRWRMRVSRPVKLLKSTLVEVPTVIGWLRPVILLPASSITGLTPGQLEAILAHELAHIRRLDHLVNAVQNLIETLLFYHPAVWWISNCIREEREHCCDDLVVRVCRDRMVYAQALFRLEELRSLPPRFALAASGGSLLQRVRRLLLASSDPLPVGPKEFGGLALVALGCVMFFVGLIFMLGQPVYRSTARVRIDYPPPNGRELANDLERLWPSPYLVLTEIEVIRSDSVLRPAADALNLHGSRKRSNSGLNDAGVLAALRNRLQVKPVPKTALIEIQATDENPQQAASIANAVAAAYQRERESVRKQRFNGAINLLKERLELEDARTRRAESNVEYLRVSLHIPENLASGDAPALTVNGETLRKLESVRIESMAELARQQALLNTLKTLNEDQLIEAITSSGIADPYLNNLLQQLNLVQQRQIVLVKDYGPGNNEVVTTTDQVADLKQKIHERVRGILLGIEAKAEATKQSLAQFQQQITLESQNNNADAKKFAPYFEAKRVLQELEAFRQVLLMKIASEKTDEELSLPRMVEIVDQASPSALAVAPNRPRSGALMACGLALGLAGAFLVRHATPAKTI